MTRRQATREEILQAAKNSTPSHFQSAKPEALSEPARGIVSSFSNRADHPDIIDMGQVNRSIGRKPSD